MTDNLEDAIFEIARDGSIKRTITISGLKKPTEIKTDAEGITWMYGERYALVMEGGEEMAIMTITPNTTSITRTQATIFDLFGDPKGVAYKASEDALYWVSQTAPMRVVKSQLNGNKLVTIWNKVVDNLPDAGLADVAVFPRLSSNLFLLGQSSHTIMEVDMSGQTAVLVSSFSLANWPIPRPGAMAFDSDGSLRIVGKHAAGFPQDDFSIFIPTGPIFNQLPVASAGSNLSAVDFDGNGGLLTIDSSLSNDPDGAIIDYKWLVNGVVVSVGFGPKVPPLTQRFGIGSSSVTLIVRDDVHTTNQTSILVVVRAFTPLDEFPYTHPQPSNFPSTSVNYLHPGSSYQQAEFFFRLHEIGSAEIRIYDQIGREVKAFQTEVFPAGDYRAPWDLKNSGGERVSSGVYFVLIKTPDAVKKERLVVVR